MVHLDIDDMREIMGHADKIRNVSMIGHTGHGKTVLGDALLFRATDGSAKFSTGRDGDRGATSKSVCVTAYWEGIKNEEGKLINDAVVNIMDTPGQVDFSSEVTAALRVTDGAIVVVDAVDGCCVQTENVIRNALGERVKPIMMINKVDRVMLELLNEPEEAYQTFAKIVESVNVVMTTYEDEHLGDTQCFPEKGTVAFGSGLGGWAFTLPQFARIYAKKFGVDETKMTERLWGDYFFDQESKKWIRQPKTQSGKDVPRAFCQFIMSPITQLCKSVMQGEKPKWEKMLKSLKINLKSDEKDLEGKDLLKAIMMRWIPAGDALLDMAVVHLPNPITSQKYRVDVLYEGPADDACGKAIEKCDPEGPLMLYISKMVPTADKGRFYAFGRVFAGTVSTGQKVRIQGPAFEGPGHKEDLFLKTIQRTALQMGKNIMPIDNVPAGNTCLLVGIDQFLQKTGTITTHEDSYNMKLMKFSVSPVVRVAVQPKNHSDLPKLVEGLKRLMKSDPCVQAFIEESGEHIVAGAGELHLQMCLKDLVEDYMGGAPIKVSDPVVSFRETVTELSRIQCLSKSPNKHNRLFCRAQPLAEELCLDIEAGKITPKDDVKVRARFLADDHGWDINDARKIWGFGPNTMGPNCVVDATKAVQYLNEIKDSVIAGFEWVTKEGVMCEENVRSVRFNIEDVSLHADSIHRGGGQIIPTARRCFYACMLTAAPTLQEPVYAVEITCPQTAMGGIYGVLNRRRGAVVSEEQKPGTPLYNVKAFLPVLDSFGFSGELMSKTSGQAFPTLMFDHWQVMNGDPLTPGNKVYDTVMATRKRKGLNDEVPPLDRYYDKL